MPLNPAAPDALIVSGDALIQKLLTQKGAVVIPAYACRLDGFVNDTFTEYANASIYRPASVCRARLVSALRDTVTPSGRFYLGFTMYTAAGYDEAVEVYIGHRQVALARHPGGVSVPGGRAYPPGHGPDGRPLPGRKPGPPPEAPPPDRTPARHPLASRGRPARRRGRAGLPHVGHESARVRADAMGPHPPPAPSLPFSLPPSEGRAGEWGNGGG